MRRAAKIDTNQPAIVQAFRDAGCSVQPCHTVGAGFPDLVVGYKGFTFLVEVKDGAKPPSARRLTSDQVIWHANWLGTVHIAEAVADVEPIIAIYQRIHNLASDER